jgi:hypothetical protein
VKSSSKVFKKIEKSNILLFLIQNEIKQFVCLTNYPSIQKMRIECLQPSISLLLLGQVILGLFEAIYLNHYSQYKSQCYHVWEWLTAACVINIFIPIFTSCGLSISIQEKDEEENKKEWRETKLKILFNGSQIFELVIALWATFVFFNINKECYDYWNNNAKELWIFIIVHFVLLWIILANGLIFITCDIKWPCNFHFTFSR